MANNKQRLFEVMHKVNPEFKLNEELLTVSNSESVNEELAVASDGGYYNKPEQKIIVSSQESEKIKQITDAMYNDLFTGEGTTVVGANDKLKLQIINDLRSSGIQMENDSEEGTDYFWITNEKDLELAKDEFNLIVSNLYDKVQDKPINEVARGVNPKYTHFAVLKSNNKILNGWDYHGYDSEELKADKRHYFYDDIKDPFNFDNWNKDQSIFTLESVKR
jgi:hypothetical protein